jgi:AcrR family transcriptional regulator
LAYDKLSHEVTLATSQYANNRVSGRFQSDEQRTSILDAAEGLFLEAGIEKVSMGDLAAKVGINRATLYRYFANRDEVAMAVFLRMMKRPAQTGDFDPGDRSLEGFRRVVQNMIRSYPQLIERYRFSGLFDRVYLDHPSDSSLSQWAYHQLSTAGFMPPSVHPGDAAATFGEEMNLIINNVVWFFEKLALRGEMTWAGKGVPLEQHLRMFEDMILGYIDRLIETRDKNMDKE